MAQDDPSPAAPPDVWPPAPTNYVSPSVNPMLALFISGTPLARWVVALLWLNIAISIAEFLAQCLPLGGPLIAALILLISLPVLLATGVCFLAWTHRAYQNLVAFHVPELRYSPGWAVGWFFIPPLSFWKTYEIFREIWKASEPDLPVEDPSAWHSVKVPAIIGAWWICWIVSNMIGLVIALNQNKNGVFDAISLYIILILSILVAVLAMKVMLKISARQDAKWQALTNSPRA